MRNQKKAYIYASTVVIFWSTISSAFKISLRHSSVLGLLLGASLTATIVLFLNLLVSGKLGLLKQFRPADYIRSAILGFMSPFLYYTVLIHAYDMLLAQEALVLNFVWPILLVLLSIPILKQKIGAKSLIAIAVSFAGVVVIATRGDLPGLRFSNPLGVVLALSTTVVWALYWLYNTKDSRDEALRLFVNFAFGSTYIFAAFVIQIGLLSTTDQRLQLPTAPGILGAVYVGLFELGITFLLWLKALRLSETTARVANLVYLVPFLGLLVINHAVGESILPSTVAGLILIITGIVLQKIWAGPPSRQQAH